MVNLLSKVAISGVVLSAILYQFVIKTIVFELLGFGRSLSLLSNFDGVKCERITELGLESCEDMWLHEPTGFLYMACSNTQGAAQWLPAIDALNASGRSLNDRLAVLDTRGTGRLASRIKWLSMENFSGINGDGTINLHGFDVWPDEHTNTLRIVLINHRPPFDPLTGKPVLVSKVGANSTMEVFQTQAGSDTMRHIRTHSHELIATPNRVQWVNADAFVWSNDHSSKTGLRRHLTPLLGGGSIGYCDRTRCNIAKQFGSDFRLPNGVLRGRDGLIYVPDMFDGKVRIFSLNEHHTLDQIGSVKVPYPVDNLSMDENGDIFAAAFPQLYKWSKAVKDPYNVTVPSTVFRISGGGGGGGNGRGAKTKVLKKEYAVEKVLEDDGSVLPGSSIAVHDARTGRYFLGGIMSPFISICETI